MSLNERIAECLKWPIEKVQSRTLRELHDLVLPIDKVLAQMIRVAMQRES